VSSPCPGAEDSVAAPLRLPTVASIVGTGIQRGSDAAGGAGVAGAAEAATLEEGAWGRNLLKVSPPLARSNHHHLQPNVLAMSKYGFLFGGKFPAHSPKSSVMRRPQSRRGPVGQEEVTGFRRPSTSDRNPLPGSTAARISGFERAVITAWDPNSGNWGRAG